MSLVRLIIWSSLIGGWSAFFGWLVIEIIMGRWVATYDIVAVLMATLIAIPIGGGISAAYGFTNAKFGTLAKRLLFGFAGGLVGGLLGILVGSCIFSVFSRIGDHVHFLGIVGRVIGWAFIGIGIGIGVGASEGAIDRSFKKLRNGIIGGVVGGLCGGLFFHPVGVYLGNVSGRALSFVLLGLCIGLFIGLAQVILKETWLTVEAGFRPGRQMILGQDLVTMGTSEKASLIFIAYGAKGVEPIHLKITKLKEGGYALEDNQSRTGTLLNGQPIRGTATLSDGDAIQFGVNVIRFNERVKRSATEKLPPPMVTQPAPKPPMPAAAITAKPPVVAIQPAAPKPVASVAIQAAPAKPAPAPKPPIPAAKPAPAPPPKPQEGRCPICDRAIVGVPGQRRCGKCFTTF